MIRLMGPERNSLETSLFENTVCKWRTCFGAFTMDWKTCSTCVLAFCEDAGCLPVWLAGWLVAGLAGWLAPGFLVSLLVGWFASTQVLW